jgi:hypothetical protein
MKAIHGAISYTARDWTGTPDRGHRLQGVKLDFKPRKIMPRAGFAPAIAGLPGFNADDQAVKYFEMDANAADKKSLPPMAQCRFNHADALAVAAYLRSLRPSPKKRGDALGTPGKYPYNFGA